MLTTLTNGLSTILLAVGAVFAALVVLVGLIRCAEKILPCLTLKNIKFGAKTDAKPIVVQTVNVNDDEVVAVITAAISAILEEEQKNAPEAEKAAKKEFVVRSIRRVSNAPAWNRAGREEQVYSRL